MKKIRVLILLLILPVFLAIYLSISSIFRIKKIIVVSNDKDINGLSVFSKQNYLFLDEGKLSSYLPQRNVYLKNLTLKKKFPDQITLVPEWRTPVAKLKLGDRENYVDISGFPAKSNQNIINGYAEIRTYNISYNSKSADWRIVKALSLIANMNKYGFQFSPVEIKSDSSEMTGKVDSDIDVQISLDKDPIEVAASLQTIISRFRIEGKIISRIDYRFDKPVVVLKNE